MNKSELIDHMAQSADITKDAAAKALNAGLEAIIAAVAKNEPVAILGFGTFKASPRAARIGKNPKTGEEMQIAATVVAKFSPGAGFKTAVAAGK